MRSPYTDWCTLLQSEYWKTWQNQHLVLTSYPLPKMVGKVTSYPSLALELMSSVVAEFWLLTELCDSIPERGELNNTWKEKRKRRNKINTLWYEKSEPDIPLMPEYSFISPIPRYVWCMVLLEGHLHKGKGRKPFSNKNFSVSCSIVTLSVSFIAL